MGATGAGPFENDDALDFLDALEDIDEAERRSKLAGAMKAVAANDDYVEAAAMAEAVAAAVLVAACDDPESIVGERNVPRWVDEEPVDVDDELEDLAHQALYRALRPEGNELWELWAEGDGAETFTKKLNHYLDALGDDA